jgi:hypothetical protein
MYLGGRVEYILDLPVSYRSTAMGGPKGNSSNCLVHNLMPSREKR